MSANVRSTLDLLRPLSFAAMRIEDLDEVVAIEKSVYSHPWTRGNFVDSIQSGYQCWVLRDAAQVMLGYFFVMQALDEAHLLNISVHGDMHGRGIGKMLLDKVCLLAHQQKMQSILLEVRPSNTRAIVIYQRYGFVEIGRRRDYYPAAGDKREEAIVMRLAL
ncbi:ribosomal-protein-alanine N-acetyltransferase [Collimonas sp. OK242]|jgi:ribosomal-protein-alanine N-acetyltransferase|uniref:ribosomal protein S18-alanine N-acetyltransferase n=1 Tax=Collimonas sp. OK242 TaxID=1798195 RepID=UPI00089845FA|nr:ribosomal protein S18-alanine N-acetyltransferase [Collimonas sp. OK242]SDX14409.1 ribosomal-protein-alanine N-acetyltransferase [Collimonas sp. OK242]